MTPPPPFFWFSEEGSLPKQSSSVHFLTSSENSPPQVSDFAEVSPLCLSLWETELCRQHCLFVYLFMYLFLFYFSLVFCFLGPHLWHMEVPRRGVKLELQLPAYTAATATQDLSLICNLHHSSLQHRILNPLSEAKDQTHILTDTSRIHFH